MNVVTHKRRQPATNSVQGVTNAILRRQRISVRTIIAFFTRNGTGQTRPQLTLTHSFHVGVGSLHPDGHKARATGRIAVFAQGGSLLTRICHEQIGIFGDALAIASRACQFLTVVRTNRACEFTQRPTHAQISSITVADRCRTDSK